MARTVLITGASGQIGANLIDALSQKEVQVVATDLQAPSYENILENIPVNVLEEDALRNVVREYDVDEIYHLAALLSAKGESKPQQAWEVNMKGLLNVLNIAKEANTKVFWPSSIAVFGYTSEKHMTPQRTIMEPSTVYGISKVAGELWCQYYHNQFGVDVRSLRFPGLISWKGEPGGGTTDYAIEIFHEAIKKKHYTSFLQDDAYLPMLYMDDAIEGILQLMDTDAEEIRVRTSYNISGMSFSPREVAGEIQKHIPEFTIDYEPDFRQEIATSWSASVDDQQARADWGWNPKVDLPMMTEIMLKNLKGKG